MKPDSAGIGPMVSAPVRIADLCKQPGGLIVIPGSTRNEPNGEVIDKIGDLDLGRVNPEQIRATLGAAEAPSTGPSGW